jgi:hypothetical protein
MVTGTEVKDALEFAAITHRMIMDPDLVGDALLLALGTAEVMHSRHYTKAPKSERTWSGIALRVFGDDGDVGRRRDSRRRLQYVIREDIPQYRPPDLDRPGAYRCDAPMVRREGKCGKSASLSWGDRNPETGEMRMLGLCTRHRRTEYGAEVERLRRVRLQQWRANGEPEPPANRGGVLARYFDTDWGVMYEWADPHLSGRAPAEGRPSTPPRPTLTLIRGDRP